MASEVTAINKQAYEHQSPVPEESMLRVLAKMFEVTILTFSQIAQNSKYEIDEDKRNFKRHSIESAEMTKNRGFPILTGTIISVVISGLALGMAENNQKFVQLLAEKPSDIVRLFDLKSESIIKNLDTLSQLDYNKLQNKNNESQSMNSIEEKCAQVLQAIEQLLQAASARSQ